MVQWILPTVKENNTAASDESRSSTSSFDKAAKIAAMFASTKTALRQVWDKHRLYIISWIVTLFLILIIAVSIESKRTKGSGNAQALEPSTSMNGDRSPDTDVVQVEDPMSQNELPSQAPSQWSLPDHFFGSDGPGSEQEFDQTGSPVASTVTYEPGYLSKYEHGLFLSQGLTARVLAQVDELVNYDIGGTSFTPFHPLPDFGATYNDTRPGNPGGWIYVSNSETKNPYPLGSGGVGAFTFNAEGGLIDYRMVLTGSFANCGGGKTPWESWVSCEEYKNGNIWEVDPTDGRQARKITLGLDGGNFETFAYDVRDQRKPRFFVTEDDERGVLRRWTPDKINWNNPWEMLHGPGLTEFLVLNPDKADPHRGTFKWTTNEKDGRGSAESFYEFSEGMDVKENQLFFVTKRFKLFMLDLDNLTFTMQRTKIGLFDGRLDQIQRIVRDDEELMYFTEDEAGFAAGIYARNRRGQFFTILESPSVREVTGLAFSPDARRMYVAWQTNGTLFEVEREDGLPFHAQTLNIRYHESLQ